MLFASYGFILFIILVFLIYYLLPGKFQWMFLLLASYVFYLLANPLYLIFFTSTSFTVYLAAKSISKQRSKLDILLKKDGSSLSRDEKKALKASSKKKQKAFMLTALLLNIGILAVLKYTNFFISNINGIRSMFGAGGELSFLNLLLPMGISFYTFQAVGYLIDVYYAKYEAEKNYFKFALFVSFFPQLVQGPISRFSDLSKSLYEPHKADYKTISFGLQRILWGYFKKLVIADRALIAVNAIIQNPDEYQGIYVFFGMLLYALELYADFTGGIDITIGIAQTLGITVSENFKRPFFSKNIKEYWNRWHITMGTWFTDYIFFPLSVSKFMRNLNKFARAHLGNHVGKKLPVYVSSFVVWFTTGIWHGASWNFIVWGLGNFFVIMISDELSPLFEKFHSKVNVRGNFLYKVFQVVRTVLIMSCLRMFDCYRNVPLTFKMFGTMFTMFDLIQPKADLLTGLGLKTVDYFILLATTLILFTVSMVQRSGSVREKILTLKFPVRFIIWFSLFVIILMLGAYGIGYDESQFIYNQF